jgi:hypothetical protein
VARDELGVIEGRRCRRLGLLALFRSALQQLDQLDRLHPVRRLDSRDILVVIRRRI